MQQEVEEPEAVLCKRLMSQKKRLSSGGTGGSTMLSASKKPKPQSAPDSFEIEFKTRG